MKGGLDEVGMGSLAGPVVVAVTVFKVGEDGCPIEGVRDSKKLTRTKREALTPLIMEEAVYVGVGWAGPKLIDEKGISEAWQFAAKQALARIPNRTTLIVDGVVAPTHLPAEWVGTVETVKKADATCWFVSAASIVAKAIRDRDMMDMATRFPAYGWAKNVGYPTPAHYAQLKTAGPSPYHRITFLKNMIKRGELVLQGLGGTNPGGPKCYGVNNSF